MPSQQMRGEFRLPPDKEHLMEKLRKLTEKTGRSVSEEIVHAIERHLAQEPRVLAEPLASVEVVRPAKVPGKRGRKKKES